MIPPEFDASEYPARLSRLLALEVDRIVDDLEVRREFLLDTWSRHRDRGPFLDTMFSRWDTLSLPDLCLLEDEAITACEAFYRELDDFRLYMRFTQDMPTTLEDRYAMALKHVAAYGALAITRLGGVPEMPVFRFDDDEVVDDVEPDWPRLEVVAVEAEE